MTQVLSSQPHQHLDRLTINSESESDSPYPAHSILTHQMTNQPAASHVPLNSESELSGTEDITSSSVDQQRRGRSGFAAASARQVADSGDEEESDQVGEVKPYVRVRSRSRSTVGKGRAGSRSRSRVRGTGTDAVAQTALPLNSESEDISSNDLESSTTINPHPATVTTLPVAMNSESESDAPLPPTHSQRWSSTEQSHEGLAHHHNGDIPLNSESESEEVDTDGRGVQKGRGWSGKDHGLKRQGGGVPVNSESESEA